MASETYDFVVVGAGPSGCATAVDLARSAKKPSVLLIEAGGENGDRDLRVDGQRWTTFMNQAMNYGYKTSPQANCNNREVDYSRGKGLGGSSAINFGVYTTGPSDDYDEWARIVGDDDYSWEKMKPRYKALESFNSKLPEGIDSKYAAPKPEDHGSHGNLKVSYAAEWERDLPPMLDLFEQHGFPLNQDHNSGNPIGMSVLVNSSDKGVRSTASDLLAPKPSNLTIVTNAPVQKVVMEGTKAVGVESNGKQYTATKEVILAAGALEDPKILMHSGIGPKDQLEKFNIPVLKDVPQVGQGLRDHMFCPLVYTRKEGETDRANFYGNQEKMDEALAQWKKDGTGDFTKFGCELGIGYFKIDGLKDTEEYKALPADQQAFLAKDTVPHYELLTHFPIHWFLPNFPADAHNVSAFLIFYYNAQAKGQVTLQSSDPNVPLVFDPNFLGTEFDRRLAIESLRDAFRVAKSEAYTKNNTGMLAGPEGDSDEDLLNYWKATLSSSWHMSCTLKMGKAGDEDAVTDSNFRLIGFENLRVADVSVTPFINNCHIQSVAYALGVTCAEKLIAQYDLA